MKIITPEGETEVYRLVLVTDDGTKIEGCPHLHPTYDEALACPEARVTIADITGLPLPEVLND